MATLATITRFLFLIFAPTSAIDIFIKIGDKISIVQKFAGEVTNMWNKMLIVVEGMLVSYPVFNATRHDLIAGIITKHGI